MELEIPQFSCTFDYLIKQHAYGKTLFTTGEATFWDYW